MLRCSKKSGSSVSNRATRCRALLIPKCGGQIPHGKALTPELQRIQELVARIDRLECERAIL
ncbi:hypothetical protein EGJ54_25420 [Pandoraea apista]|nr:hypothetical protein EGJ54_25420 [Pandoraea apista]RRW95749.1 hypothetical protein EGJ56_25495 [Pandoraea apista]